MSMGGLGDLGTLRIAPIGAAMAGILQSHSMGWRYQVILRDLAVSFGTCQPWQRKTWKRCKGGRTKRLTLLPGFTLPRFAPLLHLIHVLCGFVARRDETRSLTVDQMNTSHVSPNFRTSEEAQSVREKENPLNQRYRAACTTAVL